MANNPLPASGEVTRLTILALLSFKPMHGYQIRREIELRQMERWADIRSGSIYQALRKMDTRGQIEKVGTTREGNRPVKVTYRITDSGRSELSTLLNNAWSHPKGVADPVEVALSFIMLLTQHEVSTLLNKRLEALEESMAELREAQKHIVSSPPDLHLMVTELFEHRLAIFEAERSWTQKILTLAQADKLPFKEEENLHD